MPVNIYVYICKNTAKPGSKLVDISLLFNNDS